MVGVARFEPATPASRTLGNASQNHVKGLLTSTRTCAQLQGFAGSTCQQRVTRKSRQRQPPRSPKASMLARCSQCAARPAKPGRVCVGPRRRLADRITLEIALSLNAGTIAELWIALETARFALGEVLEQGARPCDEE